MLLISIILFICAFFSSQSSFEYEYLIISNFILLILYLEKTYGAIIDNEIKMSIYEKFIILDTLLERKIEYYQQILDDIDKKNANIGYNLEVLVFVEQELLAFLESLYIKNSNRLLIKKEKELYKIITEFNMPRHYKDVVASKRLLHDFFLNTLPKIHKSFVAFKKSIKDR